jgi:hypothetical protein
MTQQQMQELQNYTPEVEYEEMSERLLRGVGDERGVKRVKV